MNSKSELEGGSGNGASIATHDPARPGALPGTEDRNVQPSEESEKPADADDGALDEEDMGDVDVNNSVSDENPPQR